MQGRRVARAWAFAIAIGITATAAAPARAAVYNVTVPTDTAPGQIPCTASSCSLRSAVEAASAANGEADLVQVPAGTYMLSNGPLAIPSSQTGITIAGAGAGQTIVSANSMSQVLTLGGEAQAVVTGMTLRDGAFADGSGGDIAVGNTAMLGLSHVRVTSGTALRGGGIAGTTANAITVVDSLIDGNESTGTTPGSDGGGGIWVDQGAGAGTGVTIQDSTIAFNHAQLGGGIGIGTNAGSMLLRGVTIADNQSSAPGGGLFVTSAPNLQIAGSILASNSGNGGPSNCGGAQPAVNGGGNVESGADCGLAGHQNTDPQLSGALLDAGGQTPVLTIPATSPAVDIVSPCLSSSDQRDVARPEGLACDAGAYEYQPPAAPPPTPTPTPTPTATPTPTPVAGQSVVVRTVDGVIRVRRPGSNTFVVLDATQGIPVGSTVDSRDGEVLLTALIKKGGVAQTARFFDGIFKVTQSKTTTDLTLSEALASCRTGRASAAAKKPKSRKLWGDGSGSFRTRGQYSAATVRGTKWLVQDSCAGTLTRVSRGVVSVRDNVRHKTILLRAGKRYLARPRTH